MKKTSCILLALLLLLLAACAGQDEPLPTAAPTAAGMPTAAPKDTEAHDVSVLPFDRETDADCRFIQRYYGCIVETDEVYYWLEPSLNYLLYYDKNTGESAPLCGKPECEHMKGNVNYQNKSCDALLLAEACSLSLYKGKLYYVGDDKEKGGPPWYALWRMEQDGSNKEKVFPIEPPEDMHPQTYILHRGRLYSFCFDSTVTDGHPDCTVRFISTPVDGGKCDYTVMFERTNYYAQLGDMLFAGQYCYIFNGYVDTETKQNRTAVMRWNSETGELETLYDGADIGWYYSPWVDEEGNVYSSGMAGEGGLSKAFRLEDGEWKELMTFSDEGGDYSYVGISRGVVIGRREAGTEGLYGVMKEYEVWIRTFGGETLYKGVLPQPWQEAAEGRISSGVGAIMGDENTLLAVFGVTWINDEHEDEPNGKYLVKYELTPDGLAAELIAGTYNAIDTD